MLGKLKDKLSKYKPSIVVVVAIGGGFVKYGEITTN